MGRLFSFIPIDLIIPFFISSRKLDAGLLYNGFLQTFVVGYENINNVICNFNGNRLLSNSDIFRRLIYVHLNESR